jgi:drug/metabolite transporter (DMT)-like permease
VRNFFIQHVFVVIPVVLLSYANIVLKWQVNRLPSISESANLFEYLTGMLTNVWILSVFAAGGFASISWMVALKTFDISYAYPFGSLSFLLVALGGVVFFNEKLSLAAWCGLFFIIIGVILIAKSGLYR